VRPAASRLSPPSPLLLEWLPRLEGPVLDLACGRGRHARAVVEAGLSALGIDRNLESLRALAGATPDAPLLAVAADLEGGAGIPVREGAFGTVLVFRYLHRPLCAEIAARLRPGGRLLYETFTSAQRTLGHGPRRAAHLLEPNELPLLFPGLVIERFEEVLIGGPQPEALARLVARRPG
jgi:SAM-dependent methyltransferase